MHRQPTSFSSTTSMPSLPKTWRSSQTTEWESTTLHTPRSALHSTIQKHLLSTQTKGFVNTANTHSRCRRNLTVEHCRVELHRRRQFPTSSGQLPTKIWKLNMLRIYPAELSCRPYVCTRRLLWPSLQFCIQWDRSRTWRIMHALFDFGKNR